MKLFELHEGIDPAFDEFAKSLNPSASIDKETELKSQVHDNIGAGIAKGIARRSKKYGSEGFDPSDPSVSHIVQAMEQTLKDTLRLEPKDYDDFMELHNHDEFHQYTEELQKLVRTQIHDEDEAEHRTNMMVGSIMHKYTKGLRR